MSFISEPELGFVRIDDAEDIVLREYQEEAIGECRNNIREGVQAQVLCSPTGSGKTVMGAYLLREGWRKGSYCGFVVDRDALVGQTSRELDKRGIPHGVIQADHPRYRPGELVQVISVHTAKSRGWPKMDLMLVDECHINNQATINRIAQNNCRVVGLSATPLARGMGKIYQKIVNVRTHNELLDEGFVVPFRAWNANQPDMKGAKETAGEWTVAEASKRSMPIIGDVVSEYIKHGEGAKAIVFGVDVPHCEEMQRQALAAGINAALYTYHTPDEERHMLIGEHGEFRKPDSSVRWLISVAALSRGFDVPDVEVIGMCRPLKSSLMEFLQIMGRGNRPHPGKKEFRLLDLAGNLERHYARMSEIYQEGIHELDDGKPKPKSEAKPREKKPVKCPRCAFLPCSDHCPSCGHIFPRKSTVEHEAGQLGEFDAAGVLRFDREHKAKIYSQLLYVASKMRKANGESYSKGWVAHKYHEMTGVWPRGFDAVLPSPPSQWLLDNFTAINKGRIKRRLQYDKPAVPDLFG